MDLLAVCVACMSGRFNPNSSATLACKAIPRLAKGLFGATVLEVLCTRRQAFCAVRPSALLNLHHCRQWKAIHGLPAQLHPWRHSTCSIGGSCAADVRGLGSGGARPPLGSVKVMGQQGHT